MATIPLSKIVFLKKQMRVLKANALESDKNISYWRGKAEESERNFKEVSSKIDMRANEEQPYFVALEKENRWLRELVEKVLTGKVTDRQMMAGDFIKPERREHCKDCY